MRGRTRAALLAAVLLTASLLGACGGSGGDSDSPPDSRKVYRTYTFEGEITDLVFDGAGIIAAEGYQVGDPVSAKFAVDFLGQARMTLNSGEVVIPEDPPNTNDVHSYFYARFIEGTTMPELNGGINNGPESVKLYEMGYNQSGPIGNSGILEGGSDDENIVVRKDSPLDANVQNWAVGEHFNGVLYSCSNENCSLVWADLELTAVQDEAL